MKQALIVLLLVVFVCGQQPQTTDLNPQALQGYNAKWAQGVGPGYWPTLSSGLVVHLTAGTAWCNGTIMEYAGGTLTMTNNTTNYIYLDTAASCVPSVKTTVFVASDIPVAMVVTASSAITSITDRRTSFFQSGGGTTVNPGLVGPLETHTANNTSTELDFTSCISSTYQNYEIVITRLLPATNQADLFVQVSTNGGTSYDTGALNYSWGGFREPVTGGLTGSSGSSAGFILTSQGDNGESNVTHTGLSGTYRFYDPLGTDYKQFIGSAVYYRGFDGQGGINMHGQVYNFTTTINAFRVKTSTGNLVSGTVRCYGLSN